ncbi:MAG: molybdate ABC transporter substrate-binding protein, partial [Solirubrobacteraceae bacterium]|nr:molybdate ABC transporter substrate-binding protein [Solirubrobacteraceae bacterium]
MKRFLTFIAFAATLTIASCGDDPTTPASAPAKEPVVVSAAASLKTAFTAYGTAFDAGDVRLSFAGSDVLAAQIRQGARPDVFAAANTKLPQELYAEGLVEAPTVFAGNRLVLAVPKDSKIDGLQDVEASGTKVAIGSQSVPVGAYTRKILSKLPDPQADAILGNVRSEEPDVKGIIGKLTQGAVDAGFVYITDVTAAGDDLRAVELPASLEPSAAYGVAVVKGTKNPAGAQAFVDGLI